LSSSGEDIYLRKRSTSTAVWDLGEREDGGQREKEEKISISQCEKREL
jgi:hypothetical protein